MNDQLFKADAGKPMPDLLTLGMQRALRLVQATMEYGAQKYEEHSWRDVPNAEARYFRACARHNQERMMCMNGQGNARPILEGADSESGLPHIAHEVFNLLALMELQIAEIPHDVYLRMLKFNPPPLTHKFPVPAEVFGAETLVKEDYMTRNLDAEARSMP